MKRKTALYLSLFCLLLFFIALVRFPRLRHSPSAENAAKNVSLANDSPSVAVQGPDYFSDVKPVLAERCCSCHGAERQRGRLRLDAARFIKKGGRNGPAIIAGDSRNSLLIGVLTGVEGLPRMPPSGDPLEEKQIQQLIAWIDRGAPIPEHEELSRSDGHWAFRPPLLPAAPSVKQQNWVRNPIDAFIAAGHEKKGLKLSPPAPKSVLLRRVYFDLIGLPPTREELHAFLTDSAADAYEKVVEDLLSRPQYAERWARHWMDVWRYSDPDGRKSEKQVWWSDENIWRWRDWIVRSLDQDKSYARMIGEMLAGDELAANDPEALAGTGFLVRNRFTKNRNVWLSSVVEHTGKAFLGLTINCARCHDHKFDPISQKDYYCFRALFEPHEVRTDDFPLDPDGSKGKLAYAFDANLNPPTFLLVRGDESNPDKTVSIAPAVPAFLGKPLHIKPVQSTDVKGNPRSSSGRRLALASWLCDRSNPLTARVAVNHIWTWHFGRGLVENPYDFGVKTRVPTHAALLDWLAVQFRENGWSMKQLHRLIVTSSLYRMQSSERGSEKNRAIDPENRYWWRQEPRRMEAEVVRDSLLRLANNLDLSRGGPPLDDQAKPPLRRSLYYRYSQEDKLPFLVVFDAASVEECYQRNQSVVPQQALALLNDEFVWQQARAISQNLTAEEADVFVKAAFECILCRTPTPEELHACMEFLRDHEPCPSSAECSSAEAGREYLVHVLLNHNDFLTIR
jgi:mono/diheme cytochrome c family protein